MIDDQPRRFLDGQSEDDNNEAPETPTDEPEPIPIVDPPTDDTAPPPMSVHEPPDSHACAKSYIFPRW